MRRAAVVVLIAAVPTLTCGTVNQQVTGPAAETASNNLAALDDLGVCGPIHEAIIRFGPKDSEGHLDVASLEYERTGFGYSTIVLNPTTDPEIAFASYPPDRLKFVEYRGTLQSVMLIWEGSREQRSAVWKNALHLLDSDKGEGENTGKYAVEWRGGPIRTILIRSKEREATGIYLSCQALDEQFHAQINRSTSSTDSTNETSSFDPDARAIDPFNNRTVIDVLKDFGQPSHHHAMSETLVCFHYVDAAGHDASPAETWWWFHEGLLVYTAMEFLPPTGSSRARGAFQDAQDWMRREYGAPVEERRDESLGSHCFEYVDGPLSAAVTLFQADGNPYLCVEFYDAHFIDKLGPDLRPDRSLPKRYTPPPRDSGLTREDFETETAPG